MSQKNDDDDNKDSLSNQETEANEEAADVTESFNNPHRTEESTFDMTQSMTESVVVTMKELTGSLSSESSEDTDSDDDTSDDDDDEPKMDPSPVVKNTSDMSRVSSYFWPKSDAMTVRNSTAELGDWSRSSNFVGKCIPVEYTSSPIAEIFASTAVEMRPLPPSSFESSFIMHEGSSSMGVSDKRSSLIAVQQQVDEMRLEANSMVKKRRGDAYSHMSEKGQMEGHGVSLLEQIIRTHPIWYLQHIDRSAATHLLRPMYPGNFIVRFSSKSNAMALSVRLPKGSSTDIDHYLIEAAGNDRMVRLESSPNSFKSLPLLIEHYCRHGEELQCRLMLHEAILRCRSSIQLQRLALMGQDFWTSDIAQRRSISRSSQTMITRDSSSSSSKSKAMIFGAKKRSSSVRNAQLNGLTSETNGSRNQQKSSDQCSPPTKHDRSESSDPIRKSYSAADNLKDLGNGSLNATIDCGTFSSTSSTISSAINVTGSTSSVSSRRSFLKSLFFGDSSQESDKSKTKSPSIVQHYGVNVLANCDHFTPFAKSKVVGNRPTLTLGSPKTPERMRVTGECDSGISSANSLQTFKPSSPYLDSPTMRERDRKLNGLNLHSNVAKPALKPKPTGLRREQSDLSASSVRRLAHYAENSPGPPILRQAIVPPSAYLSENSFRSCLEELKRKRDEAARMKSTTSSPISPKNQQRSSKSNTSLLRPSQIVNTSKVSLRSRHENTNRGDSHRLSVPNLADCMQSGASASRGVAATAKALTSKLGRNPGTGELQTINEGLITPVIRRKHYVNNTMLHHDDTVSRECVKPALPRKKKTSTDTSNDISATSNEDVRSDTGAVVDHCGFRRFGSERHSRTRSTDDRNQIASSTVFAFAWKPSTPQVVNKTDSLKCFPPSSNIFGNRQNPSWSAVNSELKSRHKIAKVRPTPQVPAVHQPEDSSKQISSSCKRMAMIATTDHCTMPSSSSSHNLQTDPSTSGAVDCDVEVLPSTSPSNKNPSDYAYLSECTDALTKKASENGIALQSPREDDCVSVAGTVFNEPWDSNVWENLLDLAQYGDEKSSSAKRRVEPTCLDEPIVEEDYDEEITCSLETSSDGEEQNAVPSSSHHGVEGSDEYGTVIRETNVGATNSMSPTNRDRRRVERIPTTRYADNEWNDGSRRFVSESSSKSSTYDSRREGSANYCLTNDGGSSLYSSRKTINSHSLPRAQPRFSKINEMIDSFDDLPYSIRALSPVISPPRLRNSLTCDPETKIQEYIEKLSIEGDTVFGATLRRFIECTIEGEESDPQVVIRNVRQFLNGMKNYLVKHGEGELHDLIEKERARLNANEFLNIDAILETILHKIVLAPVKPHLYHLMVREHSKNGWLQSLSENLAYVRSLSGEQLGFSSASKYSIPDSTKMETIKVFLRKMQHHYSPLKKLENLLRVIHLSVSGHRCESRSGNSENVDPSSTDTLKMKSLPPADELVRLLVYILAKTSTVGCEVEAWYMWELLPKQLLTTGDSSYYLIALFSAVDVLKSTDSIRKLGCVEECNEMETGSCSSSATSISSLSSSDAFIRVAIPDELDGSIKYHTFPGVPQMTAGKLCRVIGHQFGITNPEDHGLYLLVDGFETCLLCNECPDLIRHQLRQAKKAHLFAYKRHEAKIAWPKMAISSAARC